MVAGGEVEEKRRREEEKERANPFILVTEGTGQTTCAVPSPIANMLSDISWTSSFA